MPTYTAYRATSDFMTDLYITPEKLRLHRRRHSIVLCEQIDKLIDVIDVINIMLREGNLLPAAFVNAINADDFFRLTNTLSTEWFENNKVSLLNKGKVDLSSSHSGDIFSDNSGNFYLICTSGYAPLRIKNISPLQFEIDTPTRQENLTLTKRKQDSFLIEHNHH